MGYLKTNTKMPEEGVDLGPQRIRVFISGNSGNKEMVTHQQRIIMVLESLGIDTEVMDIAAPGMDEARDFMRGGARKKIKEMYSHHKYLMETHTVGTTTDLILQMKTTTLTNSLACPKKDRT